jgi:hypothetical protein
LWVQDSPNPPHPELVLLSASVGGQPGFEESRQLGHPRLLLLLGLAGVDLAAPEKGRERDRREKERSTEGGGRKKEGSTRVGEEEKGDQEGERARGL